MSFNKSSTELAAVSPSDFEGFLNQACHQLIPGMHCNLVFQSQMEKINKPRPSRSEKVSVKTSDHTCRTSASSSLDPESLHLFSDNSPHLYIITNYDSSGNVTEIEFKNSIVPRKVLKIIGLLLPFHRYIANLRFIRSAVAETIHEVRALQPSLTYLTQVFMDGCAYPEATYDVLLDQPTNINHFSLNRCDITDLIVQSIFAKLTTGPAARTVTTIDLAWNKITDTGAELIALCLRQNRRLRYVNLTKNELTDFGAKHILDALKMFPVTREELIMKRQARFEFMLRHAFGSDTDLLSNEKCSIASRRNTFAEILDTQEVGNVFLHAFDKSNTKMVDGVTYCFGNSHLCALNLSYNHLRWSTLVRLVEVVKYQASRNSGGLVYVNIDGNFIETCQYTDELTKLLDVQAQKLLKEKMPARKVSMGKVRKTSLTASIKSPAKNKTAR